jgi:hypothetical protein
MLALGLFPPKVRRDEAARDAVTSIELYAAEIPSVWRSTTKVGQAPMVLLSFENRIARALLYVDIDTLIL